MSTQPNNVDERDLTNCPNCGNILGKSETYCWKCEQQEANAFNTPEGMVIPHSEEQSSVATATLPLDNITLDPRLMIRASLDEDAIARYSDISTDLPSVTIFNDGEHHWLADGFHRVEAAYHAGLTEIAVDIREGTFNDALEYAAIANTQHGKNLTREEYKTAVLALKEVHPEWGYDRIARALSRTTSFVRHTLDAERVRRGVSRDTPLQDRHLQEIKPAPPELWEPIVEAAEREGWTSDEIRDVVKGIKSPETPPEQSEALLLGESIPLGEEDDKVIKAKTDLKAGIKDAKDNDALLQFERWLKDFYRIQLNFDTDDIVGSMDDKRVEGLIGQLPQLNEFLFSIEGLARQKNEFLDLLER